jgi:hypothetical protein
MEQNYCSSCEKDLTPKNTASYGGFDAWNYEIASSFGHIDRDVFIKCDPCFDEDIDRYLDSVNEM